MSEESSSDKGHQGGGRGRHYLADTSSLEEGETGGSEGEEEAPDSEIGVVTKEISDIKRIWQHRGRKGSKLETSC